MQIDHIASKVSIIEKRQQASASRPAWLATIYRLITFESRKELSLARECQKLLDSVEKIPVIFSFDPTKTEEQQRYYTACLKTAKSVISVLSSTQPKAQLESLMLRVAALQYRIEAVNGGLDRSAIDPILAKRLVEMALQWKQKHPMIVKKEITAQETKKLEEASAYPEFARLLLNSPKLQECFFNWALQNNNEVKPFVEFPATCARLKSVYLASRVGKLPGAFQIRKEGVDGELKKVATLPFYTKNKTEHINILDEAQVVDLDGGHEGIRSLAINQIFNIFSRKNKEIGNVEIFKDGIRFWNCHLMGSIDLSLDNWWEQLPIIEELSTAEMEKRIDDTLLPNEWIVFAKSSRTTPDMDLDGRHGYLEVGIPTSNGTYRVYPFGIFPRAFPDSIPELILFLGNTNKAKISYPDENFFYSHRQQASYPIKLTVEEAKTLMKVLQKELIRSRFGHLIFQFGAENCAYWAQMTINTVESKKHNFFKLDFVKSYPLNPLLKSIFNFIRAAPNFCREAVIKFIDRCFWSTRGVWIFEKNKKIFKSHHTSDVRNACVIYQPGYLHQQIAEGKIKGYIYLGNC
jgi:hypothetical protein